MDDSKCYVQLNKEGVDAFCAMSANYGYVQGAKDTILGMSLGLLIMALGLAGAEVVDHVVERHKVRKNIEDLKNKISK